MPKNQKKRTTAPKKTSQNRKKPTTLKPKHPAAKRVKAPAVPKVAPIQAEVRAELLSIYEKIGEVREAATLLLGEVDSLPSRALPVRQKVRGKTLWIPAHRLRLALKELSAAVSNRNRDARA